MTNLEPIFESYSADKSPQVARYSHVIEPAGPGYVVELSGIVGVDRATGRLVSGGAGPESACISAIIFLHP